MNQVIIIGGGPAGSVMGSYLSLAGIKNIILESAIHPRPHVGESMVTSSTRVYNEIGFLPTMEKEGFPHKYGASWHDIKGTGASHIWFDEFPQEGISQPYTYHVDRGKLDLLLLKHAEKLGSEVYEGVTVKQVLFDEHGYAVGVRAKFADQEIDLPTRMIVDASGRNTLLGRQLGIKKKDPIFNQYAVHAWFENVKRGEPDTADFIHIYFLPVERGWAWQIPINDHITSMGIVAEKEVFMESKGDIEGYFYKYANSNEGLKMALSEARRINEFKQEGDYSYSMDKFVGDGFMLIGDAARFVDPIFSSGVSIALYSAKYGSQFIRQAFETGDFSEAAFKPYEMKMRAGVSVWYEFIRLYYKLLPLFTHFIQSKKYRLEVLRLLQGEVYDRKEVPVLAAMRQYIETVEKTENHLLRSKLTSIPIDDLPEFTQLSQD
ncbi:NAD(P)/FAD-dependent oxidoreductase [Bellilinea sp.]|uniref:NAD(P)/FAD-dependent oxidoreductase n=1 Tax=Bellilinea sp. TaxID=2838785 RepID=UPI002ADE7404|nr:NAD(P)/FAD-dependent oxidoreductase [Bellilinea sp.]